MTTPNLITIPELRDETRTVIQQYEIGEKLDSETFGKTYAEIAKGAVSMRKILYAASQNDDILESCNNFREVSGTCYITHSNGRVKIVENPVITATGREDVPYDIDGGTKIGEYIQVSTDEYEEDGQLCNGWWLLKDMDWYTGCPDKIHPDQEVCNPPSDEHHRIWLGRIPKKDFIIYYVHRSHWSGHGPLDINVLYSPGNSSPFDGARLHSRSGAISWQSQEIATPHQMTAEERLQAIHKLSSQQEL